MNESDADRYWAPIAVVAILLLSLLFFRDTLRPGAVLFSTDDNIGGNAMMKFFMPDAFLGWWDSFCLLGMRQVMPVTVRNVALWLLPIRIYINWVHAIYIAGAWVFLILFFRTRGLRVESGLLGLVTALWLASNFTLIYAGHIGKFGNVLFATLFLWCMARAVKSRQAGLWAVLAGGAMGNMFMEQPDVAFFFACVLGPYALFAIWKEHGWDLGAVARIIVPLILVAALFAVPPVWLGYQTGVRGVASMEREDPAEKWAFCTQWSWPPEECIDFIAPGYLGWRSGEPEGPYIGRMGRSAGWEKTHQGFQNFKLENQYLGAIPIALAAFAALAALIAWRRRRAESSLPIVRDEGARREILFWAAAALVTLLLAFGKYFPLYGLFYQFPIVSSIRNPNKFLPIFQLAVAILAAYGFELVVTYCPKNAVEQKGKEKTVSRAEAQRRRGGVEDDGK